MGVYHLRRFRPRDATQVNAAPSIKGPQQQSVERARSIQEVSDHDSIIARRWHAADFFNSIDPKLTFGSQAPPWQSAPTMGYVCLRSDWARFRWFNTCRRRMSLERSALEPGLSCLEAQRDR
jgi:hypothetical protein